MSGLLPVAGLAASVGTGLLFVMTGAQKWRHRAVLPGVIANYRLLPEALVQPAALLLPPVEMVLGGSLIAGWTPLPVVAGIALLLLFAFAMGINVARGRGHIDCGCGGPELRQSLSWALVARNGAIAAALALRLVPAPPLSLVDMLTAAAAGTAALLLYLLFQTVGSLAAVSRR